MWKYVKISPERSPMTEILDRCSCTSNLSLVVYNLSKNHVECAVTHEASSIVLDGSTLDELRRASHNEHAILAFDLRTNEVYKIDAVPGLEIASAVLLCVVTELLNGTVMARKEENGIPTPRQSRACYGVKRDASGRFVKAESATCVDDCGEDDRAPQKPTRVISNGTPLSGHRFHIGRH